MNYGLMTNKISHLVTFFSERLDGYYACYSSTAGTAKRVWIKFGTDIDYSLEPFILVGIRYVFMGQFLSLTNVIYYTNIFPT